MRRRLDTEETFKIDNVRNTSEISDGIFANPGSGFVECGEKMLNDGMDPLSITNDDDTFVSALTADDEYSAMPYREQPLSILEKAHDEKPPPMEVSFNSTKLDELVANLALQNLSKPSPVHKRSQSCNIDVLRPVLSRDSTADYSVASTIPEHSIIVNGISMEGIRSRNGGLFGENSADPKHSTLIGDRKRRAHRRFHSGSEISVGSLVGQSTILTELSSGASLDSDASSVRALKSASAANGLLLTTTGADEGIGCCQARRDKSIVKKELKHVVSMVTAPIRLLPIFKEKKAELQRAKGNLV
eukprot:CAMPEP_0194201382 /NCGR_PEP_ID=MMETSP0156-20130528/1662_1 /TAXON_ID=33649 /ORGANISM="Thalassionema nitzschioides, Strain L26-B" /LENGTH=301 /DNA_ID=CAMNT_0038926553 /DNA_START=148 /DNA_END=1053 /DNA_ORIENTATION=-